MLMLKSNENKETHSMKALEVLAQKEVSRKEFLGIAGLGLASIFGMGTILKLLTGKHPGSHLQNYVSGYGSTDYGGKKLAK